MTYAEEEPSDFSFTAPAYSKGSGNSETPQSEMAEMQEIAASDADSANTLYVVAIVAGILLIVAAGVFIGIRVLNVQKGNAA